MNKHISLLALLVILNNGCTVGPDFKRPSLNKPENYTADNLPAVTESTNFKSGNAQHFISGRDLPAEWWQLFKSARLDAIIKQSLKNNPDMHAAQAALRIARENKYAQIGYYYPSVSANFTSSKQTTPEGLQPDTDSGERTYSLHTGQVRVAYVPDVFGWNRRTVESLDARAEVERFQLEATYLTLTSNLINTVVQEASLRSQINATQALIKISRELLALFKKQEELGEISQAETIAQESALARIEQSLPNLEKQLAQTRNQLVALMGQFPSDDHKQEFHLSDLNLPEQLPISLPSKLVERRPDIRAAEENLRAANAEIGIAVANRLPNIAIYGNLGTSSLAFSKLFSGGSTIWGLAAGITQPIFQGGMLRHKQHAAIANFDQVAAQYRSTVINAFREVADALQALQADARSLKAAVHAEETTKKSLEFAKTQWLLGDASYLVIVDAQENYEQALIELVKARANRYMDTVALFQALGGGWMEKKEN